MKDAAAKFRIWRRLAKLRGERGSVMMETVIAFPVVLTLILACIQLAHLQMGRMLLHYAAFCAARSTLVYPVNMTFATPRSPDRCIPFVLALDGTGATAQDIPGWGNLTVNFHNAHKTNFTYTNDPRYNFVYVEHEFPLVVPIVGPMMKGAYLFWRQPGDAKYTGGNTIPTITLRETAAIPKPWLARDDLMVPN